MSNVPESYVPDYLRYNQEIPYVNEIAQIFNSSVIPTNNQTILPGGRIELKLPQQAFLIPDSLYIKFQVNLSATIPDGQVDGVKNAYVVGTPCYSPIFRDEILFGGVQTESLQNFNLVNNVIHNLDLTVAQKMGLQNLYGYTALDTGNIVNTGNSRLTKITHGTTTDTYNVSFPYDCQLSRCKQYIPLYALPECHINFTLESANNIFCYLGKSADANISAITNPNFTITNFELCYKLYDPGHTFKNDLLLTYNNKPIVMKTRGYEFVQQNLPAGSRGTVTLNYNVSFKSIKSVFLINSASDFSPKNGNGFYDSYDVTDGKGDYSIVIAGKSYPDKSLNVAYNRAGILSELLIASKCFSDTQFGNLFDKTNNFSISDEEFSYTSTDDANHKTTPNIPSKFYIGVPTQKLLNDNNVSWSGVTSFGSAISVRINIPTATTHSYQIGLLVVYDSLLEFDIGIKRVIVTK